MCNILSDPSLEEFDEDVDLIDLYFITEAYNEILSSYSILSQAYKSSKKISKVFVKTNQVFEQ